jgi:4-amino-4-deoxy-L-arabinose transferase-like glycosyltransferase
MNIRLLALLVVLTVLRLVYIGQIGLSPDEAYYHEWSLRPDWWYFSKGPGIAFAMKASTALFGHTEFGVRFFAPLLGLGTSLLLYSLAKRLYDERAAFWTVLLINLTPIFNVGSLVMTIDAPSIFFWTAALCTLWRALERSPAFSGWWALSGVLIGVGWLFKMTNAVQLLCVLLLLALTPRYRGELFRAGFWSMLAAAIPFALPMIYWNSANGWPTTAHLAARGGLEKPWWELDLKSFIEFVGAHFGVYSPLIFLAMAIALVATVIPSFGRWSSAIARGVAALPASLRGFWLGWVIVIAAGVALWCAGNFFEIPALHQASVFPLLIALLVFVARRKEEANMHWKSRFLAAFTLPLFAGYFWIALHHGSEPNWTAPASVTLAVLTVAYWRERVETRAGARVFAGLAFAIGGLLSVVAVNTDLIRAAGFPLPFTRDPSARLRGWKEVAARVDEFRQTIEQQSGQKVFLIAKTYGTAAAVSFYLPEKRVEAPGHPPVYVPESPVPENQFHFWGRYDEYEERKVPVINEQEDSKEYGVNRFAGRTAIYITDRARDGSPPEVLMRTFERWEKKTTFQFSEGGLPLREVQVFVCYRYKPGMLLD